MHDWNDQHGAPPKLEQWRTAGPDHPGHRTVFDMFGGWTAALVAAGLRPRRYLWDADKVKLAVFQWTYEHGRPPTSKDWALVCPDGTHPSFRTGVDIFGSWSETLRQAGYAPADRSATARARERRKALA